MRNINTIKRLVKNETIIFILSFIALITIGYILLAETNAEAQERIAQEIEVAKIRNISFADTQISELNTELEELEIKVQKKKNDIYIYNECKELNTVKDLPTNCRDITISLKDDL